MNEPVKFRVAITAAVISTVVGILFGNLMIGGVIAIPNIYGWDVDFENIDNSVIVHGCLVALGLAPSLLAGYLAAHFSRRKVLRHGLFAGILMLPFIGLLHLYSRLFIIPTDETSALLLGLQLFTAAPVAFLGSAIWQRGFAND